MSVEFWFLIGAALVFWMQAGFAMVETGFTRAKNAGNIIMKNLMDFCIGTVVFSLLGYSLMMGEDTFFGLIGKPNLALFTHFKDFIASPAEGFTESSYFVFNLVFCATTATIVSGAMAERTKFAAYCVYSAVISLLIYPIEAHWIWGGGWLSRLGFHDYAGSCAIHMVGGIAALIGAVVLGPRIGKYVRDTGGKVVKVNAIPGHSIPLGALGVFILWLGWYGFNGAAATTPSELSAIFLTTTIAPAVATVVTMVYTWIKNGKPDVSMCLNASLAGLVGITAGCDALDAFGAIVVGTVSGILVVVVVELLDLRCHVDDPVGAVGVHLANGVWGTVAVGLLANPAAPAGLEGLLYTGSARLLGVQVLGIAAILAWTAALMWLTFKRDKRMFPGYPEFFFVFSPNECFYGCGQYAPSGETMTCVRQMIVRSDPLFRKADKVYRSEDAYTLYGEPYKRSRFPGESAEKREWLDRRAICLVREFSSFGPMFSPSFAQEMAQDFQRMSPVYHMLIAAEQAANELRVDG